MEARQVVGSLWAVILLGTMMAGTAAAQSDYSSSMPQDNVATASSSTGDATVTESSVDKPANTNPDTSVKQIGTPFPLRMDPGGYRIGPVHLVNVTTSGFYNVATPTNGDTQTLLGSSIGANFVYNHPINNGLVSVQADPTVYISGSSAYVNSVAGVTLTKQLTARWTMDASVQWTYFQNDYLLQTPEYLLAYASGGVVLQTLYAQQNGSTMYESNSFSMNYQLGGRTQLALSPTINASFSDIDGVSYLITQLGGGATLTHSFTPARSGSVYANITHATSSQAQTSGGSGWTTYSIGAGFNQRIGQNWYLNGSIGASQQSGVSVPWLPTGSASLMRVFRRSTIAAAYSRSTAAATLLSSGYFDQADISFARQFGTKVSTSIDFGAFRSISTGSHDHGTRARASVSYRWRRNLGWFFSYSYTNQVTSQATLFAGRTNYVSAGLNWTLGQPGAQ